uniref:Uncharacterized protein n=1 Tax=Sipha flava TaxID=143950 RepID=A0A2S2R5S0_9HEMI
MIVSVQVVLITSIWWSLASAGIVNLTPCLPSDYKKMSLGKAVGGIRNLKVTGNQRPRRSCHYLGNVYNSWTRVPPTSPSGCSRSTACAETPATLMTSLAHKNTVRLLVKNTRRPTSKKSVAHPAFRKTMFSASRITASSASRSTARPASMKPKKFPYFRNTVRPLSGAVKNGENTVTSHQLYSAMVSVIAMSQPQQTRSNAAIVAELKPRANNCVVAEYIKCLPVPKPKNSYQDPIMVQETNKVDYPNGYSLARGAHDATATSDEYKYYDDNEKPAQMWKVEVAKGEHMTESEAKAMGVPDNKGNEYEE